MVMSVLTRKLLRNIWSSKGQYVAVAAVVLCGVTLHVSMYSAMRNLTLTRDTYMREYRFPDLFFHVEQAPRGVLSKVRAVPGVARVRGRIVHDVTLDVPGNEDPVSGRVVSLPWPRRPMLADIHVIAGRYPGERSKNEILINPKFAQANSLKAGSVIHAAVNDRQYTLAVVGTALSPEYVYVIRDASSFLPDHRGFGIIYAPQQLAETLFGLDGAVNDIVVRLAAGADEDVVKEALEDVLDPYGLTLKVGRKDHLSYQFLDNEIKGLKDSVDVIPPVFTLVAALVSFIMLKRLVRAQRTQIGVLKACGYSSLRICRHYITFAVFAALFGALPGLLLGDSLAGGLVQMYTEYFQFPLLRHQYYPGVYAEALGLSLALCGAAGILAAAAILRIQPAEAMRPPAPRQAGAIFLERFGLLWSALPFSVRLILRSIFRHKGRTAFTVVGIVLSCSIIVMAFAMSDGIDYISRAYVLDTQRQDARVGLFRPVAKKAIRDFEKLPGVLRAEPLFEVPFELVLGWRKKTAVVTGLDPDARLRKLVTSLGGKVDLPARGLLLNKQLADALGAVPGDRVRLKALYPGHEEKEALVAAVFEEGIGINAYMDLRGLSRLLDEPPAFNAVLLKIKPGNRPPSTQFF
jgi:putative ABC transport system permease protein